MRATSAGLDSAAWSASATRALRELSELLAVWLDDEVGGARCLVGDSDDAVGGRDLAPRRVEDELSRPAVYDLRARVPRELDSDVTDTARGTGDAHALAAG